MLAVTAAAGRSLRRVRGGAGRRRRRAVAPRCAASTFRDIDNPYTGDVSQYEVLDEAQTRERLALADAAQRAWRRVSVAERVDAMRAFVQAFTAEPFREAVARDITAQMGKPISQARGEVDGMVGRCEALMALAPTVLGDEHLPPLDGGAIERTIAREPVGIVLCIAPWNYPLLTTVNAVAAAVLAGNAVLLKHSSRTPAVAPHFEAAFRAAGVPDGVVQSLQAPHDVLADTVMQHPSVGFVAFTGSVRGGHQVYSSVARRFIDATLELGGKDPGYVAADADVAHAATTLVDGAFYNAGQSCCGIERVYVHRSVHAEFMERALAAVRGHTLGDPMDTATTLGPLAEASAVDFLAAQVRDARDKGAAVLCGGEPTHDAAGRGRFFAPTLLDNCTHDMHIMTEESFGPVLGCMAVDSDEEAVRLMNDSPYGLTAAVMTRDAARARALGAQIETGTVFMNKCDSLDPYLPWTGVKDTGKGVSLSRYGFDGCTRLKGYNLKVATS